MICAKLKPAVSGFETEFPGKVKAENLDATTEESKKAVRELGFKNHGLVIRDAEGKVLYKKADHSVDIEEARKVLQELLKKSG
jgi:hypothetical protein